MGEESGISEVARFPQRRLADGRGGGICDTILILVVSLKEFGERRGGGELVWGPRVSSI